MTNKVKVLFFSLLILFALVLYLILTSESAKKNDGQNLPVNQTDGETTALPEEVYQVKFKEIFIAYEKLERNNNFTVEEVDGLRNELLAIKGLPAKFKNLHLKFVQALDRMEDYLNRTDEQGKNASQQILNQLKADYSWLNN